MATVFWSMKPSRMDRVVVTKEMCASALSRRRGSSIPIRPASAIAAWVSWPSRTYTEMKANRASKNWRESSGPR